MSAITIGELQNIMQTCVTVTGPSKALVHASSNGELHISFYSQPPQEIDHFLRTRGFVLVSGDYIYRP
jgi:hypothetical protein